MRFEVLTNHFYRNKGAYIVGRVSCPARTACRSPARSCTTRRVAAGYVDTVLVGSNACRGVQFHPFLLHGRCDDSVAVRAVPEKLMPAKPISEIYNCMGFNKHGKTYYHRSAVRHMESTTDKFIIAPGIKGMVMSVFTLPSYPFVFKVIKDRFTPPKEVTREEVKEKYRLVKRADRPDAWRIRRSSPISPLPGTASPTS
jgi:isocitrate dehydrogenase kinase/phosphatase